MELTSDFRQYEGYRLVDHVMLRHDDLKAVNKEANPETVAPVKGSRVVFEQGKLTGVLPTQSFHMIKLQKV